MAETLEQYRNRMLGYTKGRDILKVQAATPKRIAKLIQGASAAKLRKRPAPGKWSVAEIVAHLADNELAGGFRLRFILGAPGSPIAAFDQDAWATALHYDQRNVHKSLEQFRVLREANLALLKSLTPAEWKRHGIHSERGLQTIRDIATMIAGHDINHTQQIAAILSKKR